MMMPALVLKDHTQRRAQLLDFQDQIVLVGQELLLQDRRVHWITC